MKTKIAAAMIALCVALVPAMPAWAKNSGEKTKGLLPESVEVTQAAVDEGTVDEGEVPVDLYSQRMLWGTWVLEDEEASFSKYVDVKIDGTDYQLEAFPSEFLLGTDTVKQALYAGRLHEIFDEGTYANVGYDFGPDCKVNKPFSISTDGSIHDGDLKLRTVFAVKNRTLAIGLGNLPEKPKKGTKIDITEIDYEMEWKGPRLVLSYGGTSAAYVPYCYKEDDDGKVFVGHSEQLVSSMKDGFVHISVGQEDPDYIETKYDPRVRADFEFKDDGTYSIKDYIGNEYTGSYYYSGDVITLAEEKGVTVIDIVSSPFRFEWTNTPSLSFIVGKDKAPACLGNKVASLLDQGYKTSEKSTQNVASRQIYDFTATYGKVSFDVKAINPYEKEIPLEECFVCCISGDKDSGDFTVNVSSSKGYEILPGKTTYMQVKDAYSDLQSASPRRLTYAGANAGFIIDPINLNLDTGEDLIPYDSEKRVSFIFEDDVLEEIRMFAPSYLYAGMQDNASEDDLEDADGDKIAAASNKRNEVLEKLTKAYADAGIDVRIDPATGVITMGNDILFDVDKYDLLPDSVKYVNDVLTVLANVMLDADVRDSIEAVEIGGHTDTNGTYEDNYILSTRRARSVYDAFVDGENDLTEAQMKDMRELLVTKGYSYTSPVYDKDGKEDQEKSRRVEIRFFIKID